MMEFAKNKSNMTLSIQFQSGCAVRGVEIHRRTKVGNQWLIRRENNQGIACTLRITTLNIPSCTSSQFSGTHLLSEYGTATEEKNKKNN